MREIDLILKGAAARIERERLFLDATAWQAARLVMIGYHKPRKFPEFDKVSSVAAKRPRKRKAPAELQAALYHAFAALGAEVRGPDG